MLLPSANQVEVEVDSCHRAEEERSAEQQSSRIHSSSSIIVLAFHFIYERADVFGPISDMHVAQHTRN